MPTDHSDVREEVISRGELAQALSKQIDLTQEFIEKSGVSTERLAEMFTELADRKESLESSSVVFKPSFASFIAGILLTVFTRQPIFMALSVVGLGGMALSIFLLPEEDLNTGTIKGRIRDEIKNSAGSNREEKRSINEPENKLENF